MLTEMRELMKYMEKRLSMTQRAHERSSTQVGEGSQAKAKKVTPPTIRDRLLQHQHLLDPRYFKDWWNWGSTKPLF